MSRIKNIHPKLMECVQLMLVDLKYKLPFYGEYNLMINFHDGTEKGIPTCGVNVSRKGMNFYYNNDFLEKLTQKMINFIVIHEDFHLLFNHPKRTVTGRFNPHLANIAQDMIINHIIWQDINHGFIEIPKDEQGRNMGVFLPKEYKDEPIFEVLYEWLKEKKEEMDKKKREQQKNGQKKKGQCSSCDGTGKKQDGQGDKPDPNGQPGGKVEKEDQNGQGDKQEGEGQGDGEGQHDDHNHGDSGETCPDCQGTGHEMDENGNPMDSSGKPAYGNYGQGDVDTWSVDSILDNLDNTEGQYMDSHMEDEVPEELREAMVKDSVERLRARGLTNGDVERVLGKLRKKRKDYLREIKRSISNEIFGDTKNKSITRPNRRGIQGLKGHKKMKNKVNVLLDVSGSMGGLFEKVLAYVYRNDIEINLIQCDTRVTSVETIKNKKKLELIQIKGLGGTVLQPGLDAITENFNNYNNVILTDGYTDTLDFSKIKGKTLIVSTDNECPLVAGTKNVRQIIVEDPK